MRSMLPSPSHRLAGLAFLAAAGVMSEARAQVPQALYGHSIQADYAERVSSRRRGTATFEWRDVVYISIRGRIFHRHNRDSSLPRANRAFDAVDDDGIGGREPPFRWTAGGLTREWTNPRGVRLRHSIRIEGAPGAYRCTVSIERFGGRGSVFPLGQTCSVVEGNLLAGR